MTRGLLMPKIVEGNHSLREDEQVERSEKYHFSRVIRKLLAIRIPNLNNKSISQFNTSVFHLRGKVAVNMIEYVSSENRLKDVYKGLRKICYFCYFCAHCFTYVIQAKIKNHENSFAKIMKVEKFESHKNKMNESNFSTDFKFFVKFSSSVK